MRGAVSGSYSHWGAVVFRPHGRPSLFIPPRARGVMASSDTVAVLSVLAWWLDFYPARQERNGQQLSTCL